MRVSHPISTRVPKIRDVVAARGGHGDPTDLYFPDLSFRPPKRDKIPVVLKPVELEKFLREQRSRYQRGSGGNIESADPAPARATGIHQRRARQWDDGDHRFP
jgi:hypothetical protein